MPCLMQVKSSLSILLCVSMQVYWSSIFILPKKIIKKVKSMLRYFLWKGKDLKHSGAKVAWEDICVLKKESSPGLKGIENTESCSYLQIVMEDLE